MKRIEKYITDTNKKKNWHDFTNNTKLIRLNKD